MSIVIGTRRWRPLLSAATGVQPSRPPPGKAREAMRADCERGRRSSTQTCRGHGERPARRLHAKLGDGPVNAAGPKQVAERGCDPCQIQARHYSSTRRGLQFRAISQPKCRRGRGYRTGSIPSSLSKLRRISWRGCPRLDFRYCTKLLSELAYGPPAKSAFGGRLPRRR